MVVIVNEFVSIVILLSSINEEPNVMNNQMMWSIYISNQFSTSIVRFTSAAHAVPVFWVRIGQYQYVSIRGHSTSIEDIDSKLLSLVQGSISMPESFTNTVYSI